MVESRRIWIKRVTWTSTPEGLRLTWLLVLLTLVKPMSAMWLILSKCVYKLDNCVCIVLLGLLVTITAWKENQNSPNWKRPIFPHMCVRIANSVSRRLSPGSERSACKTRLLCDVCLSAEHAACPLSYLCSLTYVIKRHLGYSGGIKV